MGRREGGKEEGGREEGGREKGGREEGGGREGEEGRERIEGVSRHSYINMGHKSHEWSVTIFAVHIVHVRGQDTLFL